MSLKVKPLSSHSDWEIEPHYLSERLHFKVRGSQVLEELVLDSRFLAQRAEKGFIIAKLLKETALREGCQYYLSIRRFLPGTVNFPTLLAFPHMYFKGISGYPRDKALNC